MVRKVILDGKQAPGPGKTAGRHDAALQRLRSAGGIYPLNAPGLPSLKPSSAFVHYASKYGDGTEFVKSKVEGEDGKSRTLNTLSPGKELPRLLAGALYSRDFVLPIELAKQQWKDVRWLPGQLWSPEADPGPRAADVMIVSKTVGFDDIQLGWAYSGPDGQLVRECLQRSKAEGIPKYYVTYANKFSSPKKNVDLRASWRDDGAYLLQHEIRIVRPKYILCMGKDALQAVVGSGYKFSEYEGQIIDFQYDTRFSPLDTEGKIETAKLMVVINPRQVLRDQSELRRFQSGIDRFVMLVRNKGEFRPPVTHHKLVDNVQDLIEQLRVMESDPEKHDSVVSVDAEWHGAHPVNAGSYVRTIQVAWRPGHAVCVKLHEAGGAVTEGCSANGVLNPVVIEALQAYLGGGEFAGFRFKRKRVVGHFFNADMEWLLHLGLDLKNCFRCPLYDFKVTDDLQDPRSCAYRRDGFKVGELVPAWYRTKYEGGADTGLMAHAIEESASPFGLSNLALRYTPVPRYDQALLDWKTAYCKEHKLKDKDLEGYGDCPDDILVPYGNYDADVGLQLYYALNPLLDSDYDENSCREAFWESQIAAAGVLDMHMNGISLNKQRVDQLFKLFNEKKNAILAELRAKVRWPDMNPKSTIHAVELLFGHQFTKKVDELGKPVRVAPEGAAQLRLTPVLDTSNPPKKWADIDPTLLKEYSPTTKGQAILLLQQELMSKKDKTKFDEFRLDVLQLFSDYKYLAQALQTVLRPPVVNSETNEYLLDDDGNMSYDSGLSSFVCDDGKIRTHIYQTKETGRWSTARPNLQNMAKKREDDYVRILGDAYKKARLRSIMRAQPGYVLLEVDYIGAELFGMAVLSGDSKMIDHVMRNQLPEDHPEYYDIHSNVAVASFNLACPPTKKGLELLGKKSLRIIAKSILFGLAYGRGPAAIALEARQQNVPMTIEGAQKIIDTIFGMYPKLLPFLNEAKLRATGAWMDRRRREYAKRYLCNPFGRYRRFPTTTDKGLLAEFERQAMNFPLQSLVASAVSRAVAYLVDFRDKYQEQKNVKLFNLILQIHDALLLEVPYKHVKLVAEKVIPECMRKRVPIYPTDLGGNVRSYEPYYLGIDGEVMIEWGHQLSDSQAKSLHLPTGNYRHDGVSITYSTKD